MVNNADENNETFSDRFAQRVAFALMESVRGDSLEAGMTAACDVVYNQWATRDRYAVLTDSAAEKLAADPLRNISHVSASRIADSLRQFDLTTREQHSAVFEKLVEMRESKLARAGLSHSSVPAVANLMAQLAGRGRTVLDPACGFGGTLLAAARNRPHAVLTGVDVNADAAEFARRRLELAGYVANIEVYDWLNEEPEPKWDTVVVEPPMGMKIAPRDDFARNHPLSVNQHSAWSHKVSDGDSLWLSSVADSVAPDGRAVILAPDGVGFRGGDAARLREALILSGRVEAIIAMPAGSVLGSSVATCVWVIGGEHDARKSNHVLLVNARAERASLDSEFDFERVIHVAEPWLEAGSFHDEVGEWFARPVPAAALIEQNDATPQRHLSTPPEQAAPRPPSPGRLLTELRLQSFKSVGPEIRVPLKPLTLIYGKNSAGKSSLIQSILLLKQSIEAGRLAASGPLINLGSIAGLAHNHNETSPIVAGLSFVSSSAIDSPLGLPNPRDTRAVDFQFVAGDDRAGAVEGIDVGLGNERFRWSKHENDPAVVVASVDDFVHMVSYAYSEDSVHPPRKASTSNQPGAARTELRRMGRDSVDFVLSQLTPHGPTRGLLAESRHRLSGTNRVGRLEGMLRTVGALFGAVGDELHAILGRVAYLGPLRQAPERLSLRATAQSGLDVPFFLLDNTSEREEVSLRLQQLGVPYDLDVVTVAESADRSLFGDMAALVLTDTRTGTRLSPADVGFGISQVLPIVTELSARTNSIILIEQPEIHLHPAMQADLADLLIESVDESGRANQVIAETHSETIMLRLQRRIREGVLRHEDIVVLYVDQDDSGTALVRQLRLDSEGDFLDSWPHGFFADRFDDVFGDFS